MTTSPPPDDVGPADDETRGWITAAEAAARLGVKRETIYAYVSRGLLTSRRALDGKTSLLDPTAVATLASRRRDRSGRLEVPVVTSITEVTDGRVRHRGHDLADLVAAGHHLEDLAELLWSGSTGPGGPWAPDPDLTRAVRRITDDLASTASGVERLMAGVVAAAAADPFRDDLAFTAVTATTRSLMTALVETAGTRGDDRPHPPDAPLARRLWPRLTAAPVDGWVLLDRALVVLADHGMATSTLAARLAASTRAAPHAVVLAGLGALAGPLHGGASRAVHHLLVAAHQRGGPAAVAEALRERGRLPGVGHPIHRTRDPRHELLLEPLLDSDLDPGRLATVARVTEMITTRATGVPNVDLALGSLTFAAGMEPTSGELIFALARLTGWIAHALEEYAETPLRFRAVGRYVARPPAPPPPGPPL